MRYNGWILLAVLALSLTQAVSAENGGQQAAVGNISFSENPLTAGSNVNASIQIESDFNATYQIRVLVNGTNRWNYTINFTTAPGWSNFTLTLNTSELSTGDYALNFSLYNNTGGFLDWNDEPLTITAASDNIYFATFNLSSCDINEGDSLNATIWLENASGPSYCVVFTVNSTVYGNHTISCTGDDSFTFNVDVSNLSNGTYNLTATLYTASDSIIDALNSTFYVSQTNGRDDADSLSVNKTVLNEGSIVIGDTVQYLINVTNSGQSNLTNITVLDNYDVDLNYTNTSITPTEVNISTRIITWANATNLTANESLLLYVNFTAIISADVVANLVNVTALNESGNTTTASASEQITIYSAVFSKDITSGWNLISLPLIL